MIEYENADIVNILKEIGAEQKQWIEELKVMKVKAKARKEFKFTSETFEKLDINVSPNLTFKAQFSNNIFEILWQCRRVVF